MVGPGRVGTALGMALTHAGYDVAWVAGRGEAALAAFTERVPTAAARPATEATRAADLVVIAVSDDALDPLVRELAGADAVIEDSRWVHTAGGQGAGVLEPVRLAGAAVAACHPAQTFPDADTGYASLPGTAWAVTASEADRAWARVLVTDLRGTPVDVEPGARPLYHTGLSIGSNATSTVVTLARDLLLGAGVADPDAFLGPLATTSASGAAAHGAERLTGPVRRGDTDTIAAHVEALRTAMPEAVDAYLSLARMALGYARRAGLDPDVAAAVATLLDSEASAGQHRA